LIKNNVYLSDYSIIDLKAQRTFIIGDIHGCFDELIELLNKVGLTDDDLLISLGDIVDRGNKSKQVFEYLRDRPNTITLIGNHERKHLNGVLNYAQEIVKVQFGDEYPAFLDWLRDLRYHYETDEAIIVHAAFEHDKKLGQQKPEVLSGSTAGERILEKKYEPDTYWTDHYKGSKPIIYGHHVVGQSPEIKNNTYGIDTGACHGGWLTAIELPGFIIHQVKSATDYWLSEQRKWQIPVLAAKDWLNMDFESINRHLNKLSVVEDPAVKQVLDELRNWVDNLAALLPVIKNAIDVFCVDLQLRCPDKFNEEANKFDFKTFLFKSRAKNLNIADLQKSLNTPAKINTLANELQLVPIQTPGIVSEV
jgi:serine/threonine protein phosphatase 1